jgi:hypothetical protein
MTKRHSEYAEALDTMKSKISKRPLLFERTSMEMARNHAKHRRLMIQMCGGCFINAD